MPTELYNQTKEELESTGEYLQEEHTESIREALNKGTLKPTDRIVQEHLLVYPDMVEFITQLEPKDKSTSYVEYHDEKAYHNDEFRILYQLLWKRAHDLAAKIEKSDGETISLLDCSMGGGKLLTGMNPEWHATGYEPDYPMYQMATGLLQNVYQYKVDLINEPFEFHFATPNFPQFDLAVSIPYCDRDINCTLEADIDCQLFHSYCYYCMARSVDVLYDDGYAVFAMPKTLIESDSYKEDREKLLERAIVVNSETFNSFVILTLQKNTL